MKFTFPLPKGYRDRSQPAVIGVKEEETKNTSSRPMNQKADVQTYYLINGWMGEGRRLRTGRSRKIERVKKGGKE